jgi:ATP-dependent exoDNAse (exonuclease V) alpha subunit
MIMRNILISEGLANGALAFISELHDNVVEVTVPSGAKHMLPRISFTLPFQSGKYIRHQFPLQLGFAMTISKSQGKTAANHLIVDLTHEVFAHGQLYVAMSRSTSPQLLHVINTVPEGVLNVVYDALIVEL